jgi:hypothetical protein
MIFIYPKPDEPEPKMESNLRVAYSGFKDYASVTLQPAASESGMK